MARETRINIIYGPDKWDLALAMFDQRGEEGKLRFHEVKFMTHDDEIPVIIHGIKAVGVELWEIEGRDTRVELPNRKEVRICHYDPLVRKGYLEYQQEEWVK